MRMTTISMNQEEEEDPMLILSQYYSDIYTQTPQGETRVRRRRKKNKGESTGMGWKKRRLSDEQVKSLELNFGSEHKLESARKNQLAMELGLDPRQVAVWFQNRRARWKGKQLEEEYTRLKTTHEAAVVDKCKLEAEVLKLREELSEARKEIKKLAEQFDGVSEGERSCSPSSCISMDTHQAFLGEFGVENAQDFFYMPENGTYVCEMEWLDLFGP